jgi:hypothetical protein
VKRDRVDEELTVAKRCRRSSKLHLMDLRKYEKPQISCEPPPCEARGIVRPVEAGSGCSSSADW